MLKAALRAEVESVREPEYAAGAQRYMKSALPYLGVRMPRSEAAWRVVFAEHPLTRRTQLAAELRDPWDESEFREERYTALALLERLVVEGAWWDLVDTLARRVGDLVRRDPGVAAEMRVRSRSGNLWQRRPSPPSRREATKNLARLLA